MEPNLPLTQAVHHARHLTDSIFSWIRSDSWYERPIPERHRFIFYLGHLEAFDWNLMCTTTLERSSPHESLDQLFAFGIDPPEGQLPRDHVKDWPSIQEVYHYNHHVRDTLDPLLGTLPDHVLHVAVEHRLMHAETLSYILHNLTVDRKTLPSVSPTTVGPSPEPRMIAIASGAATLGRESHEGFRWDNECESQVVTVPAFAISKYKVTNGEFLEFVKAGAPAPHFWVLRGKSWFWLTMTGEIPLPLDWPVYVTWDLAHAFAQWKGKVLPTEAQFHRAAFGTPSGEERSYPWGDTPPDPSRGNFNCQGWDPISVTATPRGDSALGVSQLVGNGWEWTSTAFHPFDGFEPYSLYPGYSAPFFDGDHYVLKGGSAQTAGPLLRRSFRNWFRSRYPYAYAGFRCVES